MHVNRRAPSYQLSTSPKSKTQSTLLPRHHSRQHIPSSSSKPSHQISSRPQHLKSRRSLSNSRRRPLFSQQSPYITSAQLSRSPDIPQDLRPPTEQFLEQHAIDTVFPQFYLSNNPALWPTIPYCINHNLTTDKFLSHTLPEIPRVGSQQMTNNNKALFQNVADYVVRNGGYISDKVFVEEFDISPQKQLHPKALIEQRYSVRTIQQNWGLVATQDIEPQSTIISIPHNLFMLPSNGLFVTPENALEMSNHRKQLMDYQNFSFIVDSMRLSLNALIEIIEANDGKSFLTISKEHGLRDDSNDQGLGKNGKEEPRSTANPRNKRKNESESESQQSLSFDPNEFGEEGDEHLQYDNLSPEMKAMNDKVGGPDQSSSITHRKALEYVSFAFVLVANRIMSSRSALFHQIEAFPANFPANDIISEPDSNFAQIAKYRVPEHGGVLNEIFEFIQSYTCGEYYKFHKKLQKEEKARHDDNSDQSSDFAPSVFLSTLPHNDQVLKAMSLHAKRTLWEAFYSHSLYFNPDLQQQEVADMIKWAYYAISTRSFNNFNHVQAFFQTKFKQLDEDAQFREMLELDRANDDSVVDVGEPGFSNLDDGLTIDSLPPRQRAMLEKEREHLNRLFVDPENQLYIPPIIEYINESNTPNCVLYPTPFDPAVSMELVDAVNTVKSSSGILPFVNTFISSPAILDAVKSSSVRIPSLRVVTSRPIKRGEQITISYHELLQLDPITPITPQTEAEIEKTLRTSNDMKELFHTSLARNPLVFDYFKQGMTYPSLPNGSSPATFGYFPSLHISDDITLIRTPSNNSTYFMPSNFYLSSDWNKSIQETNKDRFLDELREMKPKTEAELTSIASKYLPNSSIQDISPKVLGKDPPTSAFSTSLYPQKRFSQYSGLFFDEPKTNSKVPRLKMLSDYYHPGYFEPSSADPEDFPVLSYDDAPIKLIIPSTRSDFGPLLAQHPRYQYLLETFASTSMPNEHTGVDTPFLQSLKMGWFGPSLELEVFARLQAIGSIIAPHPTSPAVQAANIVTEEDALGYLGSLVYDKIDTVLSQVETKMRSRYNLGAKKHDGDDDDDDELDIEYWFEGLAEPVDDEATENAKLVYHFLQSQQYCDFLNSRSLPETIKLYDSALKQKDFDAAMSSLYLYHHTALAMHCTKVFATRLGLGLPDYDYQRSAAVDALAMKNHLLGFSKPVTPLWNDLDGLVSPDNINHHMQVLQFPTSKSPYGSVAFF